MVLIKKERQVDLTQLSSDLTYKDGIYWSKEVNLVSYPASGNDLCYQFEDSSFWFNHRNKCIVKLVMEFGCPGLFADVGGGNGFVSKGLSDAGIESVLIEPGVQGVINAKERGVKNIICSSFEDLNLEVNLLGAVGLFDVIEHIDEPGDFLAMIRPHLKLDSYIFITVPAYRCLWSNEDDDAGHFMRYNSIILESTLKDAGFNVVYSSYLFSFLPIPIFLFRSIPSYLGLLKGGDLKRNTREHTLPGNGVTKMLDKLLKLEYRLISQRKRIPFGSSCLIVGKKN